MSVFGQILIKGMSIFSYFLQPLHGLFLHVAVDCSSSVPVRWDLALPCTSSPSRAGYRLPPPFPGKGRPAIGENNKINIQENLL